MIPLTLAPRPKRKYGNKQVVVNGLKFDSKAEHARWAVLSTLERAGEISNLRTQVPFELIPAQVAPGGRKVRNTVYVADFVYQDKQGQVVVEDVKGMATPEYRLKKKMMLYVHRIDVKEVRL